MDIFTKCGLIWGVSSLLINLLKSGFPAKDTYSSWEELIKHFPHLQSVENKIKKVNLIGVIAIFLVPTFCIYISAKYSYTNIFALIFLVMAFSGIVEGFVSFSSRVYSNGYKYKIKYFYDENKEYSIVAKYIVVVSLTATIWIAWILIDLFE